ncbi:DUF6881 domain-containing protein [Tenacibaculum maritimum]|uniref:DUF6881 domain-containing protein n=1 Tax=Tenacibaculum maritimum TaxID=107401 RepID=UPI0012E537C1|nr:hypothetical protein [Tenacibaculum maritimum]CAA0223641.1 conserved hypothetical protein [Tenacibaculum maritimum]CAA0240033.1 conserved hypothetical protein [Tenacibaculum maritimum]
MNYYKAKWLTATKEDPFRMIFEIGSDRFETRKIEFFERGLYGYAYNELEFNGTGLGTVPVPPIKEINESPEFEVEEITKSEFEFLWTLLIKNNTPNATEEDNS